MNQIHVSFGSRENFSDLTQPDARLADEFRIRPARQVSQLRPHGIRIISRPDIAREAKFHLYHCQLGSDRDCLFFKPGDNGPWRGCRNPHGLRGGGIQYVHGDRPAVVGMKHVERDGQAIRRRGEDHHRAIVWKRFHFERQLCYDAERTECAKVQFHQIIAGYILDNAAAAPDFFARVREERNADEVIAQGAVTEAAWPRSIDGDGPTKCRRIGSGKIHRQPLLFLGQHGLQGRNGDPRLHGDRHIRGGVINNGVVVA
jgi:hypothetical protein